MRRTNDDGTTSASGPEGFTGFEPGALQFLADLADNNRRDWFQPRKGEYERLVRRPMEALCAALAERFAALELPLQADPARSLFRIHRDTRFSADKSPYKTWQGATFPWLGEGRAQEGAGGVGGYFHLAPGDIFVGGGMWHPSRERLAAFRSLVDRDPSAVIGPIEDPRFVSVFGRIGGDRLSRNPRGYPKDHPHEEYLRLKDVVFSRRLSDRDVESPRLPDVIASALETGSPVLRLLADL